MQKQLLAAADKLLRFLDASQLGKMIRAKRYLAKRELLDEEIAKLERELLDRRGEREALERKIQSVMKAAVGGARPGRSGPTLADAIVATLEKAAKPLGLTEVTKAILEGGYRTGSAFANFRTTVAHKLKAMRGMLSKSAEGYGVKKASKKARAGKPERKAKMSSMAREEARAGAAANA